MPMMTAIVLKSFHTSSVDLILNYKLFRIKQEYYLTLML